MQDQQVQVYAACLANHLMLHYHEYEHNMFGIIYDHSLMKKFGDSLA